MKKIKITCNGNRTLPLEDLQNFQGNLKTLSDDNFKKLKRLIIKRGFSFPVFVWDNNKILDGHQRLHVLSRMIDSGDFELKDKIPVCDIEADTEKEAAEKLLELQGSYGEITSDGLASFVENMDIDINEIIENLEMPNINIGEFINNDANFNPGTEDDQGQLDKLDPKIIKCPHCEKTFDARLYE